MVNLFFSNIVSMIINRAKFDYDNEKLRFPRYALTFKLDYILDSRKPF